MSTTNVSIRDSELPQNPLRSTAPFAPEKNLTLRSAPNAWYLLLPTFYSICFSSFFLKVVMSRARFFRKKPFLRNSL